MTLLPRRALDVSQNEIARGFKLAGGAIEPLSFIVPRKADSFQSEYVFPLNLKWRLLSSAASFLRPTPSSPLSPPPNTSVGRMLDRKSSISRLEQYHPRQSRLRRFPLQLNLLYHRNNKRLSKLIGFHMEPVRLNPLDPRQTLRSPHLPLSLPLHPHRNSLDRSYQSHLRNPRRPRRTWRSSSLRARMTSR